VSQSAVKDWPVVRNGMPDNGIASNAIRSGLPTKTMFNKALSHHTSEKDGARPTRTTGMLTHWPNRPFADCLAELDTDETGLTEDKAASRLARHGLNRWPDPPQQGAVIRLLRQFNNGWWTGGPDRRAHHETLHTREYSA